MEYSNLIHDFVDGTLSSGEESKLFSELASNGGLRSELKQFIEFERTARFDTDAFVPSAQTTANIFARVGIDSPAFNPITSAKPSSGFMGMLSKYTQGIITGIITAILTASVMYFGMNSNAMSNMTTSNNVNKQDQKLSASPKATNVPLMSSVEKEEPKIIERVVIKYIPVEVQENQNSNQSMFSNDDLAMNSVSEPKSLEKSEINNIFSNEKNIQLSNNSTFHPLQQIQYQEYDFQPNLTLLNMFDKTGISIEVSGSDYWTFPSADVVKPTTDLFENKTLSILYPLTKSFHLGAELRQESFYHRWEVPIDDKSYWSYKSNNNYYSAGILFRWMPYEFKYFAPFSQASFGFNQGGPISRFMLGTEFNPSSDYGFIIGLEGSLMYYNSNNTWLPSKKIGLHYGLKFKL